MNILLGVCGSVATVKIHDLVKLFLPYGNVQVVATEHSMKFFNIDELMKQVKVWRDIDGWVNWKQLDNPITHIELSKWANVFIIAPLDANTMAKLANGLADNLLTCVARCWDFEKPFYVAPAMNTKMLEHPITKPHTDKLTEFGIKIIPTVKKKLACGDFGDGAMAELTTIVNYTMKPSY